MGARAKFGTIRSLAAGGISGSYASVGTALTDAAVAVCFTNNTQGDMMFTTDTNEDQIFVASGSFKLWDIQSNRNGQFDDRLLIPAGTQFSVKQVEAPVDGSVYVEVIEYD